jgi:hypothetical protein
LKSEGSLPCPKEHVSDPCPEGRRIHSIFSHPILSDPFENYPAIYTYIPFGFPTKFLLPFFFQICAICPAHLTPFDSMIHNLNNFGE